MITIYVHIYIYVYIYGHNIIYIYIDTKLGILELHNILFLCDPRKLKSS